MNFFLLFTGASTAIAHVLTGPDHLSAVTPMIINTPRKSYLLGLLWAVGHLFGIALIGVIYLFFKEVLPLEEISGYSEQLVGLLLIAIGLRVFYKLYTQPLEREPHPTTPHNQNSRNLKLSFSLIGIGFIHGLAGVAHFFLFLPVLSFDTYLESITYIGGFGIGSVLAMVLYSLLIGKIVSHVQTTNNQSLLQGIRFSGGFFSIAIGIYWLYLNFS